MSVSETVIPTRYNVKVDIHEIHGCRFIDGGKDLVPNPCIDVEVCGQHQQTAQRQQGFIGLVAFSFSKVYQRSQHWIYRQWVVLRNPDSPAENMGSLLLSVGVFGPGDSIPVLEDKPRTLEYLVDGVADEDQIGKRTVDAPDIQSAFHTLSIGVHRGHDIARLAGAALDTPAIVTVKHGGASQSTRPISGNSPDWNATIVLPCFVPYYDDGIYVELWSGGGSSVLIGTSRLNLDTLLKEPFPAFWLNFYWHPPPEGILGWLSGLAASATADASVPTPPQLPSEFAGRLLISASCQKVQSPSPQGVRLATAVPEPPMTEYIFWIDFYEVRTRATDLARIEIEVCLGPHKFCTSAIDYAKGAYICDNVSGRLEAFKLFLPPLKQAYDLFFYIRKPSPGGGRVSFCRESVQNCLGLQSKPRWFALKGLGTSETFEVLATIHVTPANSMILDRSPRLMYNVKPYLFRAMIYEAFNIPCLNVDEFPSSFVQVELAGRSMTTTTMRHCLHPSWFESFEIQVLLPENLSLASDINVSIMAEAASIFGGGSATKVGYFTIPISKVPTRWDLPPDWHIIRHAGVGSSLQTEQSKLLCCFELLPAEMASACPFNSDIRPPSVPATIHFFLVGVRLFGKAVAPSVTISYGRDIANTDTYLWAEGSGAPRNGQEGNWNFLKEVEVDVELPTSHIHNAQLELIVTDSRPSGLGGETSVELGRCFVPLTPLLPWLRDDERAIAEKSFQVATVETVLLEAAEAKNRVTGDGDAAPLGAFDPTGNSRPRKFAIPHNDPDAANAQVYKVQDFVHCDDNLPLGHAATRKGSLDSDFGGVDSDGGDEETGTPRPRPRRKGVSFASEVDHVALKVEALEGGDKQTGAGAESVVGSEEEYSFERDLNFDLVLMGAGADERLGGVGAEDQRETIEHELEADIDQELLPYFSIPIVKSSSGLGGFPEIVGRLKYVCAVFESKSGSRAQEEITSLKEQISWLIDQYALTRDLVVRVYLLSARGLVPPSGTSDPAVFAWVKNANDMIPLPGGLSHNIKDTGNTRKQGFRPEFNKCFCLHASLPEHSIVSISLNGAGGFSEELIGTSHIDIEDLWFNPKYQALLDDDAVPIEQRTLKLLGQPTSQGSLRLWVEVMSNEKAQAKPLAVLASPDPEQFELRMVVWRVKKVSLGDESSISFFVRAMYQSDDLQILSQDSDTHYNSRDGTGRFNWRYVWPVTIPAQYPSIKFQIFSSFMIQSEPIGECNIDLSYDLAVARKLNGPEHRIPKTWYNFTLPDGKIKGMVEISGSILPSKEAEFSPVGKGRDEPNRNPYLEPVLENRTYVDWKALGEKIQSVTGSIMSSAKYGLMLTGGIIVGGLILFLIVLLKK